MDYRTLGTTGIKVSSICLGTMTWGEQNTEAEGHEQMDYALDRGINFFDTAEMYAVPPRKETQGRTEEIIGTWFAARKARDKVILATKVAGRAPMTWLRDNGEGTSQTPEQIGEAVNKSLRRLQTDYIDLYQLHWPDRPINLFGGLGYTHIDKPSVPIEDILGALQRQVEAGKIRHIGLSNETPWGTMTFLRHAETKGLPRVQSIQNAYNLLNRTFEQGGAEIAHREKVGLLAYSPLAQGYLTGKYRNGANPEGSRRQLFNRLQRYETPGAERAMELYFGIAEKHGIDPSQMALQYVTTRPFVTSNIIGATTMEQLKTDIASTDLDMTEEMLNDIEQAHLAQPNSCP